jgi:hypothetical protein
LTRSRKETVDLMLYLWRNHHRRPLVVGARQSLRSAKEAANQWALIVYLTAIVTKVWTVIFRQRNFMFLIAFNWKSSHFL